MAGHFRLKTQKNKAILRKKLRYIYKYKGGLLLIKINPKKYI